MKIQRAIIHQYDPSTGNITRCFRDSEGNINEDAVLPLNVFPKAFQTLIKRSYGLKIMQLLKTTAAQPRESESEEITSNYAKKRLLPLRGCRVFKETFEADETVLRKDGMSFIPVKKFRKDHG